MFFPIFFSFLQICFIPGFIVYLLLNKKVNDDKLLLMPVFAFGLSLIINYVIVFFLTYIHLYTRYSLTILLILEGIILVVYYILNRQRITTWRFKDIYTKIINELSFLTGIKKSFYTLIEFLFLILSIVLLVSLLKIWILNFGRVFEGWDSIFSWNRWAVDFYNNKMPHSTYHYPQLIPANWSIAYVLCNYPFQFIPKTIMHLFLILPIYSFIILGIKLRRVFFYISIFFVIKSLGGQWFNWTDGFVDVSVAFFSVMVFLSLILMKKADTELNKFKLILLSMLFVCGSAITKQAGFFIILVYPIILFIFSRGKFSWTYKEVLKSSLVFLGLVLVFVVPYYIWAEMQIKIGNAASEISYVTKDIYKGASYSERFAHALELFKGIFSSRIIFFGGMLFFLFSFTDKIFRPLNLFFIIPYFFIWALFFSYDIRNVAIIIPYFSLSIGVGLEICIKNLIKLNEIANFKRIGTKFLRSTQTAVENANLPNINAIILSRVTVLVLIISIPVGIIIFNKHVNMERLQESQKYRLMEIGDKDVNLKLYSYNTLNPINKKIITDYHYLSILPELGQFFEYGKIENLEATSKVLKDESCGFLLWTSWYADSTKLPSFIGIRLKSGEYTEVFRHKGYRFIKIR